MNMGIIGTGNVARTLAGGWMRAGHSVTLGSRDPGARTDLPFPVAGLDDTARGADVVVNATPGGSSRDLLARVDAGALSGKPLVDVANAVTPSFELVYPNSSLGEELQEMLPEARVVKTLNTLGAPIMVDPSSIGPSNVFLSGDDADAKAKVAGLLRDLGWSEDSILDLGGISSAKGPEYYFLMFASLWQALGTPTFNVRVVR